MPVVLFPVHLHPQIQILSKEDSVGFFPEEPLQLDQNLASFVTFSSLIMKVALFVLEERWLSFSFCWILEKYLSCPYSIFLPLLGPIL